MKLHGIILSVFAAATLAAAGMQASYDPEQVESGKPFALQLTIPIRELPAQREVPTIDGLDKFQFSKVDSTDGEQMDFFRGPIKYRTYRYHMVAPGAGRYTVGPINWVVGGTPRQLGKLTIDVQRSLDAPGLAVSVTPSRTEVYEGEQFNLNMVITAFDNFQGDLAPGDFDFGDGFWAHRSDLADLKFVNSAKPGVRAEANARLAWLAPTRSGTITIPAATFKYTKIGAPKVVEKRVGNFYSKSVTQTPEPAETRSSPVTIRVKPLPTAGKPADFSGLVGKYSMTVAADHTDLKVGEALTLTVVLQGDGKPGAIPDPQLPDLSEFRTVPPESKVEKILQGNMVVTRKTLKLFLYPRRKGEFPIAPLSLNWFDPATRTYRDFKSEAITVRVERGDSTAIPTAAVSGMPQTEKKDIETLGTDIRYIHAQASLRGGWPRLYRTWWVWVLFLAPWIGVFGVHRWAAAHRAHMSDSARVRREGARKRLQESLAEARRSASGAIDARAVYDHLDRALVAWLSDLANLEFRGLTRNDAAAAMRTRKVSEEQVEQVLAFWKRCDAARFAPLGSESAQSLEQQIGAVGELCETIGRSL